MPAEPIPAPLPIDGADREAARQTYFYDRWRGFFYGLLEPGWVTFSLIIAIRHFDMPDYLKALLPAAAFIGLFFNILTVSACGRTQKNASRLISYIMLTCAACITGAMLSPSLALFLGFFIAANIMYVQNPPLLIQIYSANYRPGERGGKVSTVLILLSLGGITAGWLGGKALDHDITIYPFILAGMAAACVISAAIVRRIPSQQLDPKSNANPIKSLSVIWQDKLFGWLLLCWMLMGATNLMTIPVRIEYMADPKYGINASNFEISLITFIVPMTSRMLSTKVWGFLFDRMNFISWRILINCCFMASFLIYYNSHSLFFLGLGMAFIGMAMGGGNIAWTLWVTKLAPTNKVSTYMSAHTALTGVRGTAAPFIGYWVLAHFTAPGIGLLCAGLMVLASFMFAAAWKSPRMRGN
ncbi:MFS transporter [Ruficoccus amylovorans]|uniref:MFS transporter n=1 Tax=Ruficoccus amylovorans TaxID=1804625 RepID=A0A842HCV8_9BACT|nr:MFS transporter [Ruficoccus amylovorans]MBC2594252.1 MFS transporter [Ruficoccus amylovorans]